MSDAWKKQILVNSGGKNINTNNNSGGKDININNNDLNGFNAFDLLRELLHRGILCSDGNN